MSMVIRHEEIARRPDRRRLIGMSVAALLLAGTSGLVTRSALGLNDSDPCEATIKIGHDMSSMNFLATEDGKDGKPFILSVYPVERGAVHFQADSNFLADQAVSVSGNEGFISSTVSLSELHKGPEVVFQIGNQTRVEVNVTPREVTTHCVPLPTGVALPTVSG